jgi:FixJ family two-component response regulator
LRERGRRGLSDINLGGISGIEMRRRLTAAGSRIPVIFITALDDKEPFRQAKEAGCVAYLHKPFGAGLLIGAINEAIGLRRSRNALVPLHSDYDSLAGVSAPAICG